MSNVDVANCEEMVLNLTKSNPDGITIDDMKKNLKDVSADSIAAVINKYLKDGTFELFIVNGQSVLKYKDTSRSTTNLGADSEEKIVYSIIEKAGNKGIWSRNIRIQSNLNRTQLAKVLKSLETKKIIKFVKSVEKKRQAFYMLYDIEPDPSVTGGAWYQDQDFESEYVDMLNEQCLRFLKEKWDDACKIENPMLRKLKSYASTTDVQKFINELGVSTVSLSERDIDSILYTVVLDGNAERRPVSTGAVFQYRYVKKLLPPPGIVNTPCGVCPVAKRCAPSGSVNPRTCVYLNEWATEY